MAFANVGHLAAHDVEDGNGLVVGSLHCDVEMTGKDYEAAGLGGIVDVQKRFEVGYEGGVLSDLELAGVVGVAVVPAEKFIVGVWVGGHLDGLVDIVQTFAGYIAHALVLGYDAGVELVGVFNAADETDVVAVAH